MVATGTKLVPHEVFECPGCGRFVEAGEDYVTAQEYEAEPGFSLHQMSHAAPDTAERRFHVQHLRAARQPLLCADHRVEYIPLASSGSEQDARMIEPETREASPSARPLDKLGSLFEPSPPTG